MEKSDELNFHSRFLGQMEVGITHDARELRANNYYLIPNLSVIKLNSNHKNNKNNTCQYKLFIEPFFFVITTVVIINPNFGYFLPSYYIIM